MKRLLAAGSRAHLPDLQGLSRRRAGPAAPPGVQPAGVVPPRLGLSAADGRGGGPGAPGRPRSARPGPGAATYRELFQAASGSTPGRRRPPCCATGPGAGDRRGRVPGPGPGRLAGPAPHPPHRARARPRAPDLPLRLSAEPGGPGPGASRGRCRWPSASSSIWRGWSSPTASRSSPTPPPRRRRFAADLAEPAPRRPAPAAEDHAFLAALAAGMPESSGVALGLDRLLMARIGARQIDDVLAFPIERA
jgi:hypothetical protein